MRKMLAFALPVLLCGCALTQKVPVSTDPSGASVYLDGQAVCAATPCSVEASTDQAHLLTIIKPGYRQKDIPLKLSSGAGGKLEPEMVTARLYKPDELDVRDTDTVVDTAVGLGIGVLKRVLEDSGKGDQ
jgi:hypothetical protein